MIVCSTNLLNMMKMIELCFLKEDTFEMKKVVATDSDGTPIYSYKKVFTWVVIDVENRRFNIHTRDLDPNYFGKNTTIRQTNDTFLDIFKKMFSFTVSSALNEEKNSI